MALQLHRVRDYVEDHIEELRARALRGERIGSETAHALGVTRSRVQQVLASYGIYFVPKSTGPRVLCSRCNRFQARAGDASGMCGNCARRKDADARCFRCGIAEPLSEYQRRLFLRNRAAGDRLFFCSTCRLDRSAMVRLSRAEWARRRMARDP